MQRQTLAFAVAVLAAVPVFVLGGDPPGTQNGFIVTASPSLVFTPAAGVYSIAITTFNTENPPVAVAIGDWTATLARAGSTSVAKLGNAGSPTFTITFTAAEVGAAVNTSAWESLQITQVSTGDSGYVNAAVSALAGVSGFPFASEIAGQFDALDSVGTPLVFLGPAPDPSVAHDPNTNRVTVYNDANGNDAIDPGEKIAGPTPAANPKTIANPDGSTTVYNDANDNDAVDGGSVAAGGERIADVPGTPTSGEEPVGPAVVSWDFTSANSNEWELSYRFDPKNGALRVGSQGLFCAPYDLNEVHPLPRGDLDGDDMTDGAEVAAGSNPINTESNSFDLDGDSTPNHEEPGFECDDTRDHLFEYAYSIGTPTAGATVKGNLAVTWSASPTPTTNLSDIVIKFGRDTNANGDLAGAEVCLQKKILAPDPLGTTLDTFACDDNSGYRIQMDLTDNRAPNNATTQLLVTGLVLANEPQVTFGAGAVADADGVADKPATFSDAVNLTFSAVDPNGLAMTFRACLQRMTTPPTTLATSCQDFPEANLTGTTEVVTFSGLRTFPGVLDSPLDYRITVRAANPAIVPGNAPTVNSPTFALFHNDPVAVDQPQAAQQTSDGRYVLDTMPTDRVAFCVAVTDPDSVPASVNVTVINETGAETVANLAAVSECFDPAPERPAPVQPNPPAAPPLANARYEVVLQLPAGEYTYEFAARDQFTLNGVDAVDTTTVEDVDVSPSFSLQSANPAVQVGDDNSVTVFNDADDDGERDAGEATLLATPAHAMFVRAHEDEDRDGLPDHLHLWNGAGYQQQDLPSEVDEPFEVDHDIPCGLRFVPDADGDLSPDGVYVDTCRVTVNDVRHIPDSVVVTKTADATADPLDPAPGQSDACCVPNVWAAITLAQGGSVGGVNDPDEDGYSNAHEGSAGTDVNNPFSNPSDTDADLVPNLLEPKYVDMRMYRIDEAADPDFPNSGRVVLLPGTKYLRVYQSTTPAAPRGPLLLNLELTVDAANAATNVAKVEVYNTQTANPSDTIASFTARGDQVSVATSGTGASVVVSLRDGAGANVLTIEVNRANLGTGLALVKITRPGSTLEVMTSPLDVRNNGVGVLPAGTPRVGFASDGVDGYVLTIDQTGDGAPEQRLALGDADGDFVPDAAEHENGSLTPDQFDLCGFENQNTGQDGDCAGDDYQAPWRDLP